MFNESVATLRQTGAIGTVPAGDAEFVVQSAVLFPPRPTASGERWRFTRHRFEDVITGRVPAPTTPTGPLAYLPVAELEHSALLDRFLDGVASRRCPRARLARSSTRGAHRRLRRPARFERHDGAGSADALVALFAGARDLTVLGRVTTEWYVFAEYLAVFDAATAAGGGRLRRLVAIHPVRAGKFEGTFGYGLDEAG